MRPRVVVDIGCGNGVIAACVAAMLPDDLKPEWVLLDVDSRILLRAHRTVHSAHRGRVRAVCADITGDIQSDVDADLAIVAFTFMEFEVTTAVMDNLAKVLRNGGTALIFLPDVLVDIAELPSPKKPLAEYVHGYCALTKINSANGAAYPFHANRFEKLLELALRSAFTVKSFVSPGRPDRDDRDRVFVLEILKTEDRR